MLVLIKMRLRNILIGTKLLIDDAYIWDVN